MRVPPLLGVATKRGQGDFVNRINKNKDAIENCMKGQLKKDKRVRNVLLPSLTVDYGCKQRIG